MQDARIIQTIELPYTLNYMPKENTNHGYEHFSENKREKGNVVFIIIIQRLLSENSSLKVYK